ncbi:MAG TPA: phage portal protein [Gammaproteobacteria bacterium]|nr:phage portal protein [Gammaproteobacteria bacterium]
MARPSHETTKPGQTLPEQTLLDRVIAHFDPTRGVRRLQSRMQISAMGNYTGASKRKRTMSEWQTDGGSANADIPDLQALRDRSVDLARNSPIAVGAIATVTQRVIGTGLAFQPSPDYALLGMTEDAAGEWAEKARAEFDRWAESTEADASRASDFYGVQALAYRSSKVSGDVFALLKMIDDPRRICSLAVQLIEADRVMNPKGQRDTERFAGGIESDERGRPIRVHIARRHPGALGVYGQIETDAIAVFGAQTGRRNVLHVIDMQRPGQSRGVPYLAPIIEPIKQISRYTEAEIAAAVMSSFFTVFVKTPTGEELNPMGSALSPNVDAGKSGKAWDGQLSSGLVVNLAEGESIESAIANRPNPAFGDFMLAVYREIAVSLSIPLEVLLKHFQSSYSAARAALLDLWIYVTTERARFVTQFCQPIAEALLEEAVARGRLAAPGFLADPRVRAAWCRGYWVGDGPGSIDPTKEADAAQMRVDGGFSTLERETMLLNGSNWHDNQRQRAREQAARRKLGLEETKP